jgi:branched-chain amino acid transport system substrate-binding protein
MAADRALARRAVIAVGLLLALLSVSVAAEHPEPTPTPYAKLGERPYADTTDQRLEAAPKLDDLEAVRIGLFVPSRGDRAAAGLAMRRGAELAIEAANASGGYRGVPFALMVRPDDHVWGSAREVVQLVYADRVWAVVGAIGGESTHIAEQIVTKAHLPLVAPAASEASLTQINIPWMFRCFPGDDELADTVVDDLRARGLLRAAVVVADTYDHHHRAQAWEKAFTGRGGSVVATVVVEPGGGDAEMGVALRVLLELQPDAVVVWTPLADGVSVLRWLRQHELEAALYGGPDLAVPQLVAELGAAADRLRAAAGCDLWSQREPLQRFREQYEARYGETPDATAALTFDGVGMVVRAIRSGGLNRARIRDALSEMNGHEGVCGPRAFDNTGATTAPPVLRVVHDGAFVAPTPRLREDEPRAYDAHP